MKFRCERDALQAAVSAAANALPRSGNPHPVLSGLLFTLSGSTLTVTGNDLDLSIRASTDVADSEPGEMVFPGRMISEIIKTLPAGTVTFAPHPTKPDKTLVTGGAAKFTVSTVDATEYIRMADPTGEPIELDVTEFLTGLEQVSPAASTESSRPTLCGVLVATEDTGVQIVATDSYRLGVRSLPSLSLTTVGTEVILPRTAVQELLRSGRDTEKMTVRFDTQSASFQYGPVTLVTRLIEGSFPSYKALIPDTSTTTIRVNKDEFVEVVKRVRVVNITNKGAAVTFTTNNDKIDVSAVNAEGFDADENCPAIITGVQDLVISFNPEYLLQGLDAIDAETVELACIDSVKPAVLRGVDDGTEFQYLVMPTRV